MQYKSCKFEVKADKGSRVVEGYASTFEPPEKHDSHDDIIAPSAFDETLAQDFPARRIKMLWLHVSPLGMPTDMATDSKGLHVRGRVTKTAFGDEALEYMNDGVVDGLSIGFDTLDFAMLEHKTAAGNQVRRLDKIKLYEWSPVIWGSNPYAMIQSVVKSAFGPMALSLPEELIAELKASIVDVKAGRVLSKSNLDRLSRAHEMLGEVIASQKPAREEEDEDEDTKQLHGSIRALRAEISEFNSSTKALVGV